MKTRLRGTHFAVMLGAPESLPTWSNAVVADLAGWGIHLGTPDDDGCRLVQVNTSRDQYGIAWLYGAQSAPEYPPAEEFLGYRSPCPFLCGLQPVGFVEWMELSERHRSDWLIPLIKVGKGALVEVETRTVRSAVTERSFSLDNLLSKFGFEDGAVLLTRDMDALQDYRPRTAEAIEKTLAEQGLELHVYGPETTCHNIFRIGSELRTRSGETVEDEAQIASRLASVTARIWTYDLELVHDAALFP